MSKIFGHPPPPLIVLWIHYWEEIAENFEIQPLDSLGGRYVYVGTYVFIKVFKKIEKTLIWFPASFLNCSSWTKIKQINSSIIKMVQNKK